jgi:hypothetical protein
MSSCLGRVGVLPYADVRVLPRLAGDEVLGDDARFGRLPTLEIGIRQVGLGFVHRGFEPAVHADLHQLQQRADLPGDARDELLEDRGRVHVVAGCQFRVHRRVDTDKRPVGRRRRERPRELDDPASE